MSCTRRLPVEIETDELQGIVDGLAARLGRSVAIDDPSIRLLAASRHFGDEDPVRIRVMLSRQADGTIVEYAKSFGISPLRSARPGSGQARTRPAASRHARRVIFRHGVRAALTPVVSQLGIDVGTLLGGVVVTETVFGIGGIGQDSVTAVIQDNLPVIIGFVIVAAVFVVVANLIVDLVYVLLDPRVRLT
jgi:Binding-protein-dependent transport system inner membrane component